MSMSLYAKYLKEREGMELLDKTWGYATYKLGPDYVYIQDLYIAPEFRDQNKAQEIMHEVIEICRPRGAKALIGSVDPEDSNSTTMMSMMVRQGFRLLNCNGKLIYLKKDI